VATRLVTGFFAGRHIVLAFALVALPSCFRREGLTGRYVHCRKRGADMQVPTFYCDAGQYTGE